MPETPSDKRDYERHHQLRGEIITDFAYLETIISRMISEYYFGEENLSFTFDVLYHEHLNFSVRRSIFEKNLRDKGVTETQFPFKKLQRIGEIRNYFAHAWPLHMSDGKTVDFVMLGRKDAEKTAEQLFKDFKALLNEILAALEKLHTEKKVNYPPMKEGA